jgi:hypothetical protein
VTETALRKALLLAVIIAISVAVVLAVWIVDPLGWRVPNYKSADEVSHCVYATPPDHVVPVFDHAGCLQNGGTWVTP